MNVFTNSALAGASGQGGGGYAIDRSIRFNPADSSNFSRTPSSAGNRKTFTWSGWVKRSGLGSPSSLINALAASNHVFFLAFGADDKLYIHNGVKGSSVASWAVTTEVYRDPSAWYHFVLVVDTTQSTSANRIKLYANNVQQTLNGYSSWDAYPSQNYDSAWNDTSVHKIGYGDDGSSSSSANGYVAEIQCLDGIAASPSDFGEYDDNNVWQPIKYAGTYGTNGFKLDFSDTSSDSALGTDSSGAGNNWSVNNLSVAAGAGNDALRDSPVNGDSANDTGAGGEITGNYCTWNPLDQNSITLQNGNLDITAASTDRSVRGTIAIPESAKIYYEFTVTQRGGGGAQSPIVGVANELLTLTGNPDSQTSNIWSYSGSGQKVGGGSGYTSYGNSLSANDVLGVAIDRSAGRIWFSLNGTWQNSGDPTSSTDANAAFTNVSTTGTLFIFFGNNNGTPGLGILNAGQRAFAYTAPSGYKCLNTANLPDPTIADGSTAFDTKLFTGNASTQSITGLNFSPDLVWSKRRDAAARHALCDTVRGATKDLSSSRTDAERTTSDGLTQFNSDGYVIGADAGEYGWNAAATSSFVNWAWDAGSSNTTIAAGGLNSSLYDQSQTWSSGTFFNANANAFYNSGGSAAQLFDNVESGSGSSGDYPLPVDGGTFTLTFSQFSSASTVTLKLAGTGNALKINGSFVTIDSASDSTQTFNVSGLTSIEWLYNGGSNYCYLGSISVDGIKLIDSGVSLANVPSIASTVRANPSAGFSIVSYTGNGVGGATVSHQLNTAPKMIILKDRSSTNSWPVGHDSNGWSSVGFLESANAWGVLSYFNNTAPTSTNFSLSGSAVVNGNGSDYIAYCFAPVEQYSSFGSYAGSGATDQFIWTGFAPAFVLIKASNYTENWYMYDSTRQSYILRANNSDSETSDSGRQVSFVSNGFTLLGADTAMNDTGINYIYATFASHPFKTARAS